MNPDVPIAGRATTPSGSRNWTQRVAIGLLLGAVGIGAVFYQPAFALLVTIIAVGSLWEFEHLTARKGTALEFPVAAISIVIYMALTALGLIHRWEGVLLSATVIAALGTALFASRGAYLLRSAFTLLGVLYIGKLLSYFITIRAVPNIGIALTIDAIVTIAFTDIFAMLTGTAIGRTPLTKLSPRKTVEGSIGGFVAAIVASTVFALALLHLAWWQGVLIGAITSLAAQAGDLVESALKRDARVKDAGRAIGSHGGVLDRFDSYIFGGIAFYFALWLCGLVPAVRGLVSR